jgi:hypothetical protein
MISDVLITSPNVASIRPVTLDAEPPDATMTSS